MGKKVPGSGERHPRGTRARRSARRGSVVSSAGSLAAQARCAESTRSSSATVDTPLGPLGEVEWNGDHRITRYSARAQEILGWPPEDVVGKRVEELPWYEGDAGLGARRTVEDVDATGIQSVVSSRKHRRPNGSTVHCEWYSSVTYREGTVARVLSLVLDVTARVEAETALREREERLRASFAAMAEGVVIQAADGKITFCNPAAERILGLSRDQMQGLTSLDPRWRSVHEDGTPFPGTDHPSMMTLRSGKPTSNVVMGVHKPEGALTWILVNAEPLRYTVDDPPYAVVATFAEITERRRLRRRLADVLDAANDGFWERDLENGSVFHSARMNQIVGLPPLDTVVRSDEWRARMHPDDLVTIGPAYERVLAGQQERIDSPYRVRHSDGSWRWVRARGKVTAWNEAGNPARISGTITDIHDGMTAQESLRRSEATHRAMARNFPGGVIGLFDKDLRYVSIDGAGEGVTGEPLPSLVGRTVFEVYPSPLRERVAGAFREALAGKTTEFEVSLAGKVAEIRCGPVTDDAGRVLLGIVTSRDITERRRSQEALSTALLELNRHVTNTPLALVEWDGDYRVTRFTTRAEEMLGWKAEEVLGRRADEVPWVPEEDWPKIRAAMDHMETGTSPNTVVQNRNRRKDGQLIHCEWYNSSLRASDGKLASVFSLVQDVTGREEARAALQESEGRLATFVEHAPAAIAMFDQDMRYLAASRRWLADHRLADQGIIGRSHYEVLPEISERWKDIHRRCLAGAVEKCEEEAFPRADGGTDWVRWEIHPWRRSGGGVGGIVVFAEVINQWRELRERLQVSARLAAMGTLVAGLAHEINNPLAAEMSGQGLALEVARAAREQLRAGVPVDPVANIRELDDAIGALEDAQEAGQRVARIVRDMAAFARPDSSRTRVRLREVVDDAMQWVPKPLQASAAVEVEECGAPDVLASAGQLAQVVLNLVTNALKATRPGSPGRVVIRLGTGEEGQATLEVIDQGTGIAPNVLTRIFEPFFTTRPVGEGRGAGLGLAVCHSIVTAHRGTITVESEVGRGSTFRVELPAAPDEA